MNAIGDVVRYHTRVARRSRGSMSRSRIRLSPYVALDSPLVVFAEHLGHEPIPHSQPAHALPQLAPPRRGWPGLVTGSPRTPPYTGEFAEVAEADIQSDCGHGVPSAPIATNEQTARDAQSPRPEEAGG